MERYKYAARNVRKTTTGLGHIVFTAIDMDPKWATTKIATWPPSRDALDMTKERLRTERNIKLSTIAATHPIMSLK